MAQNVPGAAAGRILESGGGRVSGGDVLRFTLPPGGLTYADAQIDDHGGARPPGVARFAHRPGLALSLRARFSHTAAELHGTAGFGFWNNPFSPLGGSPALPAAIWFFHAAPPSDMPLALGVPGHGWKAACIDATTPRALAWAPLALPVTLANTVSSGP